MIKSNFIKRGKKFEIFSRPQYFKLQGSSIINKNIELINKLALKEKGIEEMTASHSYEYKDIKDYLEELNMK